MRGNAGPAPGGRRIIAAHGDGLEEDAALIAAAQRVEHYEIAAYGTVRTLAEQLDYTNARRMFDDTLDEEDERRHDGSRSSATGGRLSSGINERARRASEFDR